MENDFRIEIEPLPEPEMGCTHLVTMIELVAHPADERWPCETFTDGEVLESFTTDDPGGAVEAAREAQAYTLEERLGPYGLEWQREQRERHS